MFTVSDLSAFSNMTTLERLRTFEKNASKYASTMHALNVSLQESDTVKISLHEIGMSSSMRIPPTTFFENDADTDGSKIVFRSSSKLFSNVLARRSLSSTRLFVLVAWWKSKSNLPRPKHQTIPVNSSVLTITYFKKTSNGVFQKNSLPVEFFIDLRKDFTTIDTVQEYESLQRVERQCAWLDLNTSVWETSGCVANVIEKQVQCLCNHTTTFVTLLIANTHEEIPYVVYKITLVMQIITIICLLVTVLFIAIARYDTGIDSSSFSFEVTGQNTNRTNSQISLCVSLLFMHIFSAIGGWIRSHSDNGCVATALLTQYFLLASAHWSLCEGLGIFAKLSSYLTMKIEYRSMTWIQIFVGWCMPLIITIVTAAYGIQSDQLMDKSCSENGRILDVCDGLKFEEYKRCWLGRESGMVWAAIGPLIAILILNITIFIYVTATVVKMKRKQPRIDFERSNIQYASSNNTPSSTDGTLPRTDRSKATLDLPTNNRNTARRSTVESSVSTKRRFSYIISITRSFGVLMPILGIPWLFGLLANIESTGVALSSIHAVVNGLQGFLLFLLYCACSERDLKIVKRKWRNSVLFRIITRRKYNVRRESLSATAVRNKTNGPERHDDNGLQPGQSNGQPLSQYDTLSSCRSSNGTVISTLSSQKNEKTKFRLLSCIQQNDK